MYLVLCESKQISDDAAPFAARAKTFIAPERSRGTAMEVVRTCSGLNHHALKQGNISNSPNLDRLPSGRSAAGCEFVTMIRNEAVEVNWLTPDKFFDPVWYARDGLLSERDRLRD